VKQEAYFEKEDEEEKPVHGSSPPLEFVKAAPLVPYGYQEEDAEDALDDDDETNGLELKKKIVKKKLSFGLSKGGVSKKRKGK
jgi:hypothetical protein